MQVYVLFSSKRERGNEMKHLRKVMTLVIAAIMALAVSVPALAAQGALDGDISVTGLDNSDKVSYYQILVEAADTSDTTAYKGWKLAEGFTGLTIDGKTGAEAVEAILTSGITQDQANAIAALAANATAKGTNMAVTNGTWKVDEPAAGLYMVLVTAGKSGVIYNPAFVGADYVSNTGDDPKNESNTIAITATYGEDAIAKKTELIVHKTAEDANSAVEQAISSKYGEIAKFTVESQIPVFLNSFKNPKYDIHDQVSSGLELVIDAEHPVTVKVAGQEVAAGADTYTLTPATDNKSFDIVFAESYLKAGVSVRDIVVTYYGKVVDPRTANLVVNDNDVTISYSNGPTTDKGAVKDETNHYTFNIGGEVKGEDGEITKGNEIKKVGIDENGKEITVTTPTGEEKKVKVSPLAGAKFGLYTDADCTKLFVNDRYADGATFTTGDDGIISFFGLDEGTYYVKEITAPAGYVKDNTAHKVEISATYTEVQKTETADGGIVVEYTTKVLTSYTIKVDGKDAATYTATWDNEGQTVENETYTIVETDIVNDKGTELPSTGGMGTRILYTVGGIMLVGGAIALVSKKRAASLEK